MTSNDFSFPKMKSNLGKSPKTLSNLGKLPNPKNEIWGNVLLTPKITVISEHTGTLNYPGFP
jgi:hypothetical protein